MPDLPDGGITLADLATLISGVYPEHQKGAGPHAAKDWEPDVYATPDVYVMALTAQVTLGDGRTLDITIPQGRMRSRVGVQREYQQSFFPPRPFAVPAVPERYVLTVALANVEGFHVTVHPNREDNASATQVSAQRSATAVVLETTEAALHEADRKLFDVTGEHHIRLSGWTSDRYGDDVQTVTLSPTAVAALSADQDDVVRIAGGILWVGSAGFSLTYVPAAAEVTP